MSLTTEIQDLPQLRCATLCASFQLTARERAGAVALRTPDDSVSIT